MATLQKIRSKGPLVVIVIGLALFAFVAGDLWKVLQPHQTQQNIGEINGKGVSAQEYQALIDEFVKVQERLTGKNSTDDDLTRIKDGLWNNYVEGIILAAEADKLGLTVTDAEIKALINEGTSSLLMQTPFVNPDTRRFDKELLNYFVQAASLEDVQLVMGYTEKNLKQALLANKYEQLLQKSIIANPIETAYNYQASNVESDVLLAVLPYSSIPDSTIAVSNSEIKARYNQQKEQYRNQQETRDVKYIEVVVKPSEADREAIMAEVTGYAADLAAANDDYAAFIRATGSSIVFSELPMTAAAFPKDVADQLENMSEGDVYGPAYNEKDDTYNTFKFIAKTLAPTTITYRQIQVPSSFTLEMTANKADSIATAIRGGANFQEVAALYRQTGEEEVLRATDYQRGQLDAASIKLISTLNQLGVKEVADIDLGQGHIIVQVVAREDFEPVYTLAIVKRPAEFSMDTYNKTYNDFSQFVASNGTLEKLTANAEEAGYRVLDRKRFTTTDHNVGGIAGTHEALRWIFDAKKGAVSPLYECGNSDRLLVVALAEINKVGYSPVQEEATTLRNEIRRDKKAEILAATLKGASTFEALKSIDNIEVDSVKHISLSLPAFVMMTRTSEAALAGAVAKTDVDVLSAPVVGKGGVYVFQVYNRAEGGEGYNPSVEQENVKEDNIRLLSRFTEDLLQKASVKDNRYLYF